MADFSMIPYLSYPNDETGFDLAASHPVVQTRLDRVANLPVWRSPYDLLPGNRLKLFVLGSKYLKLLQNSRIRSSPHRDRVRSGMRGFESSHSSQAVRQLEIVGLKIQQVPANCAFCELYLRLYTPNLNRS
jgi:hypothetical protein